MDEFIIFQGNKFHIILCYQEVIIFPFEAMDFLNNTILSHNLYQGNNRIIDT